MGTDKKAFLSQNRFRVYTGIDKGAASDPLIMYQKRIPDSEDSPSFQKPITRSLHHSNVT